MSIENKSINTLRSLGLAMIDTANSGHPGIVLGAAPTIYTLFSRHINVNVEDERWYNRDRFVMAAGHGSALYYATLHLLDYGLTIEDLKAFRQLKSKTPGHPEFMHTAGIDATSGPLGQGIAMGTGMAVAEEFLRAKYSVINHYTYVMCGDGDLQEGVTQEAMSFAGTQGLGRLIVLYDSNDIQLDTSVSKTNSEDVCKKYEAMNWHYILVEDGNDIDEIDTAIVEAKQVTDKPTIIEIKSKIGYGSSVEGTCASHGSPLGFEESKKTMEKLGYNLDVFEVDAEVYKHFEETFKVRGRKKYAHWKELVETINNENPELAQNFLEVEIDYDEIRDELMSDSAAATRVLSGKVIDMISKNHPTLLAGSADLSCSTKVKGSDGDFESGNRTGRNINFGVREHAMAAIANGIVLHSRLDAIVSAFFVFSDYAKPAIRMSALMNIPVIYAFTHDSVAVGEDGPTHEPVEQLIMLRSTPNLNVFRPADLNEVIASYKIALSSQNPSAIILSRQDLPNLSKHTCVSKSSKGAYNVKSFDEPDGIILASGSELHLALEVSDKLEESNLKYNVVSMVCMEIFDLQPKEYIDSILPKNIRKRVSIEMSTSDNYHKYVGLDGHIFSVDTFGISAPGDEVIERFGFEKEKIAYKIMKDSNSEKVEVE